MTRDEVKKWLTQEPFQPLEIELSSGSIVTISHPEAVMLSPTTLVVAIGSDRLSAVDYDVVGLGQITKIRVAAPTP